MQIVNILLFVIGSSLLTKHFSDNFPFSVKLKDYYSFQIINFKSTILTLKENSIFINKSTEDSLVFCERY